RRTRASRFKSNAISSGTSKTKKDDILKVSNKKKVVSTTNSNLASTNKKTSTEVTDYIVKESLSLSGDFVMASSYFKQTNSLISLANGIDSLEFDVNDELNENEGSPQASESSPHTTHNPSRKALVEHEQNGHQESFKNNSSIY
ncbi:23802_t:CDS:2, partial [Dentiscutata erythropus]